MSQDSAEREDGGAFAPGPDRPVARRSPLRIGAALGIGLAIGLVALAALVAMVDLDSARETLRVGWLRLQAAPAPLYFAILSILLMLPVPASVLYVTAGPLYGIGPSLLWLPPALAVNTLLVHAIASGVLRPRIEAWMRRRGRSIPRPRSASDETLLIVLVRVTPGIPYFVQSWTLGLAGVHRLRFLGLTLAIQMVYATGFVVLGRSAFEGDTGLALGALALIVVASLVARAVHARLRTAREAAQEAAGAEVGDPEG